MSKSNKKAPKSLGPKSLDAAAQADDLQPWHITPMGCLYASAVLIGLVLITFPFDLAISNWFREHPLRGDLKRLINLCEAFGYGFTALLVIITAAAIDRRSWRVVPRLLLGTYCAGAAANLGKIVVARWRPNTAFEPTGVRDSFVSWFPWVWPDELPGPWNSGYASFPSGHSATAVGLALSLSIFYPKGTWWFLFLAGLTMLQRIESRAHYPSDTFAGAAVACLVTALLLHSRWLERRLRRIETGPLASTIAN
jgi:membrane-associated phospholipid phosphatase